MVIVRSLLLSLCVVALGACSTAETAIDAVTGGDSAMQSGDRSPEYKECVDKQEDPAKIWEMCGHLYTAQ